MTHGYPPPPNMYASYPPQGQQPSYPPQGQAPMQPGYPPQGQAPMQPSYPPSQGQQLGYPPQGQAPMQPGYPPQGQAPMQPGYSPYGIGGQVPPGAVGGTQVPVGLPQLHLPTAEIAGAVVARVEEVRTAIQSGSRGKKIFFEVLGPQGQPWKTSAYPGFTGSRALFVCPPWAEGALPYVERIKRYWQSRNFPGGRSIYAGDDSLVSKAVEMAYKQGYNKDHIYLKRNRQFIWQGFAAEVDPQTQALTPNPVAHTTERGELRPMIFQASFTTHQTMVQEMTMVGKGDLAAGMQAFLDPHQGRPFLVTKTKTGPEARNVTWAISRMEPHPLFQAYYEGLHRLWALDSEFSEATPQEQVAAIIDANLPLPEEAQPYLQQAPAVSVPGALQPSPGYPPPPQQPPGYPPPPQQPPGYPPPPQGQQPPGYPPPLQGQQPPGYPPPPQGQQPPGYPPPPQGQQPPMQGPPSYQPGAAPPTPNPFPGGGGQPPPLPSGRGGQSADAAPPAPVAMTPNQLQQMLTQQKADF